MSVHKQIIQGIADLFTEAGIGLLLGLSDIGPFSVKYLETPQDRTMGDVALPCFLFARELEKAPPVIAQEIAVKIQEKLDGSETIERVVATGPYVNFFVNSTWLAKQVIVAVVEQGDRYGAGNKKGEKIVIESPGPNTNKPLHLGHVRNMLLGNSLAAITEFAGYDTIKVDIVNDRGVHICKSMLAYERRGNDEVPTKKSDHYVGDRYVHYAQEVEKDPTLEKDIQTMLQQRESGDTDVRALREKMRERSLQGMQETYARYGCHIEKPYYESDYYMLGKELIGQGEKDGIFIHNEKGNLIFSDEQLGDKVVLRSDGTSVYVTQDIALGKLRYEDWNMDRMVYVVGSEQEMHFKFLFAIFKALGYTFADKCYHMSYGMISLPDGKMKSREGNTVDADTLADDMHKQSYTLLHERYTDLREDELHTKAEQVAMAAIKFFILLYDSKKDFVFDREASLRFDGESGPYLQYTYARIESIKHKAESGKLEVGNIDYSLLIQEEERILLVLLSEFASVVAKASENYQPSLVARYVLELARTFNSYYQKYKIVQEDKDLEIVRVSLVSSIQQVLKNGLALLGIDVLERM